MRIVLRQAIIVSTAIATLASAWTALAQAPVRRTPEQLAAMSRSAEEKGLAEPFKGVTTNGTVQPGLFPLRSSGVSTEPVRLAANAFLANLDPAQRDRTKFAVDDVEWRKWMNQSFYVRQGTSFKEMTPKQRDAAIALMRASLSAKGLKLSQDIMKLNHTLGELNNDNFEEYDEGLYWITVMGEPSPKEPWGWQLDGHHLIVNYFVLGDQVVMTPLFVGSEPVTAPSGKYQGLTVLQQERSEGLRMLEALTAEQKQKAIVQTSKTGSSNLGEAFQDNLVLDYAGLPARSLSTQQKALLTSLIALFVDNMDDGHARVRMDEVRGHLDDTYFAWIGPTQTDSAFYYRIHSPVILIEFDQQPPVNLRHRATSMAPTRDHIHAVVRTPNGNDYGKDLLKEHYATTKH